MNEDIKKRWDRVHKLLPILFAGEASLEDMEDLLEHLGRLNWSGPLDWDQLNRIASDVAVQMSPELRGCA